MKLLNIKVQHRIYGVGTLIKQSDTMITVQFSTKTAKFQYPKCFSGFLTAVDPDIQLQITADINAAEEKARQEAEAARIAEEAKRADEEEARLTNLTVRRYPAVSKDLSHRQHKVSVIGASSSSIVEGEWITPCNPNYYDVFGAFRKLDGVCWKQSTNVKVGDIVYIYVSSPIRAISFLCQAVRVDLPEVDIDDRMFTIDGANFERHGRYMELRLLKKLSGDGFADKALQEHGLNGTVQGPMRPNLELKTYLDSIT